VGNTGLPPGRCGDLATRTVVTPQEMVWRELPKWDCAVETHLNAAIFAAPPMGAPLPCSAGRATCKGSFGVITLAAEVRHWRQRTGDTCDGRGGLVVPLAAGRAGSSEILSNRACSDVCRLAMSPLICPSPPASSPMLCRTAARPDDIASNCCSRVEERATGAGGFCGMGVTSLENCQPKAAATPMQNANRSAIASNIRLSSNISLVENQTFFWPAETRLVSSDGLVAPAENHDRAELSVEPIGAFRLLAGWQKHAHHHV
jgi:hypothetical protein